MFEVALAEAIETPAGAPASSPPSQPPNQRVAQRADPASPDIRPERSSEVRTSVRLAPADVAGENATALVVVDRREPAAGPPPHLGPGAAVDADPAIGPHDDAQADQRRTLGAVPEDAVQSLQQVEVAPVTRSASPGLWPTAPQSAANVAAPVRRARPTVKTIGLTDVASQWGSVIAQIRDDGMVPLMGVVIVSCGSAFAMQKLSDTTNTLGIERALSRVMGVPMRIRVVVGDGTNDGAEARRGPSGPDPFASRAVRMLGGRALNSDEVTDLDRRPTLPFDSWT
ncbi:MAG: hypothetical protein EBT22_13820 [Chloroflexi bacterium]|nr:hypothetical protein [Chloroflexota bacterium]